MHRARSLRLSLAAALLALLLPGAAQAAEPIPWDQAKATEHAEAFATHMVQVYRSLTRLRTGANIASAQATSYIRLKDDVRVARNESRHLERMLQDGKGREETLPVFQRLMNLVRTAREEARRMFLEQPTLDKISAARDALRQLAPYYDPDIEAELDKAAEQLQRSQGGGDR